MAALQGQNLAWVHAGEDGGLCNDSFAWFKNCDVGLHFLDVHHPFLGFGCLPGNEERGRREPRGVLPGFFVSE